MAMAPLRTDPRESSVGYTWAKLGRHLYWARREGVARLAEEDDLHPLIRTSRAIRKRRWARSHGVAPGESIPVFVVGAQRSGTNMLTRALDSAPEFEVHNENDRRVYHRYRLRSLDVVAKVAGASRHPYVMFKPLCDSQHVDRLLDGLAHPTPGCALWVYRNVDDRARSAVAKFGDANLHALRSIAAGRTAGLWQAERLAPSTLEVLSGFDYEAMTPHTAAALFWWVRNSLYFELGLDRRPDVALICYDEFVREPGHVSRRFADFLGVAWRDDFAAKVERRSTGAPLPIDPRARALCAVLADRLSDATPA